MNNRRTNGFALPTVLIASIIMLSVLLAAVASTAAMRSSLKNQYYDQLSKVAGDAGLAYAQACLTQNDYKPLDGWTDSTPLVPNADCNGVQIVYTDHPACTASSTQDYCWVMNEDNIRTSFSVPRPTLDANGRVTDMTARGISNQLKTSDKSVVWSQNNKTARLSRIELPNKQITAGAFHTCAIAFDGRAYCWGQNVVGQLGDGTMDDSLSPVLVDTTSEFTDLKDKKVTFLSASASDQNPFTCSLSSEGKAYCWGFNDVGQLGNGNYDQTSYPKLVSNGSIPSNATITKISSGYSHNCAIASNNLAYCWGKGSNGQLGNSSTMTRTSPVAVTASAGVLGGKKVISISAGALHTCALAYTTVVADAQVYCWGKNAEGQLGNNATAQSLVPVKVRTNVGDALYGRTIYAISAGDYHTCALTDPDSSGRQIFCWGRGNFGQLGNNANTLINKLPVAVNSSNGVSAIYGKTISSITTGTAVTCAIDSDNKTYCWGANGSGQVGNNSTTVSLVPVSVDTEEGVSALFGKNVVSIATGYLHTCAIDLENHVYCWGNNAHGEFGNYLTTDSLVPVTTYVPPYRFYYF